jgi:hypothetical protein
MCRENILQLLQDDQDPLDFVRLMSISNVERHR